jgi:phospholipid/cholesterol/gamma-HCH transport system substrate-binding protein
MQDQSKLPKDSTASVRTHGILGEKYVAIIPGNAAELLRDGDYIQTSASSGDLDRLFASFNKIADDVSRVAASLAAVIGNDEGQRDLRDIVVGLRDTALGLRDVVSTNREGIRDTVANLKTVTQQLLEIVDANAANVGSTLSNARKFSETLADKGSSIVGNLDRFTADMEGVISENREDLRASIVNLREGTAKLAKALDEAGGLFADARNPDGTLGRLMNDGTLYQELSDAVGGLKTVIGHLERGEGTLGKLVNDDSLYTELRGSMENLRTITEKINQGQGTIGKLVNDESVHDNLNTTLTGITDLVAGGNRFQFEPNIWAEYLLGPDQMRGYFNLDVRPSQDRFYRVGIVKDSGGRVSTKTVKVVDETTGKTVSKQEKTTTDDQFRVSVELAKRFSFLTVRGGIIESTAGIGADAEFWNDRLKLTLEGFDFGGSQGGPHLKAAARWDLWNHLFITGGVDGLLGPGGRSDAFFGAGIRFLDDDLKYMFSSLGGLMK